MKKLFFPILIFCSIQASSQTTFRNKDSTLRFMTGVFTSKSPAVLTPVYVQSLSRIDSSGKLKMLVVDTTRAAVGLRSVYWIDIPIGGGGGSSGITVGTTTITSGTNKRFAYNNSGVYGESAMLTQETNQLLVTASAAATVPFVVKGAAAHSANFFEIQNSAGTNQVFVNSSGQVRSVQNIVAWNGAAEQVSIGYSALGGVAGVDIGASSDAAIYRSAAGTLKAHVASWLFNGRAQSKQGADVASANNLSLGTDGNAFEITGTTTINLISNTNWQNGSVIRLVFSSSLTVTNNAGTSGSNINILLAGGANFSATANDILTLMLCEIGSVQNWVEVSRSVN